MKTKEAQTPLIKAGTKLKIGTVIAVQNKGILIENAKGGRQSVTFKKAEENLLTPNR